MFNQSGPVHDGIERRGTSGADGRGIIAQAQIVTNFQGAVAAIMGTHKMRVFCIRHIIKVVFFCPVHASHGGGRNHGCFFMITWPVFPNTIIIGFSGSDQSEQSCACIGFRISNTGNFSQFFIAVFDLPDRELSFERCFEMTDRANTVLAAFERLKVVCNIIANGGNDTHAGNYNLAHEIISDFL